jgi:hypothetical protein
MSEPLLFQQAHVPIAKLQDQVVKGLGGKELLLTLVN